MTVILLAIPAESDLLQRVLEEKDGNGHVIALSTFPCVAFLQCDVYYECFIFAFIQFLNMKNFVSLFIDSVKHKSNQFALTEYPGESITYGEVADKIAALHIYWKQIGLKKGDKIAILAANSANWVILYFAIVTGGYIAVLLPTNHTIDQILHCICHTECSIVYAGKGFLAEIEKSNVPNALQVKDLDAIHAIGEDDSIFSSTEVDAEFQSTYLLSDSDICTILFTSGSNGDPKGVMLSIGNISNNIDSFFDHPYARNEKYHLNTILPFSHFFGLVDDAILPLCFGINLVVSKVISSPENMCSLLKRYSPDYFFTIPLIVERIVNYVLGKDYSEILHNCEYNKHKLQDALGGEFKAFFSGGAPLDSEMEMLLNKLGLPCISACGITECGTLTIGTVNNKPRSCGKIYRRTRIMIDSEDPAHIPGEILVKGENVFKGYYNDYSSTRKSFTEDGWYKTGDLGLIDNDNYLFITGRCKDMLLTSNGENIYPEEIEGAMNASLYISESILVQRGEKLHAIVVPDREKAEADGLDAEGLNMKIDEAVREASKQLPGFTIISGFELRDEPLERTPKGSLKRYLYSDGIKEN